jgi:hypothetical protein
VLTDTKFLEQWWWRVKSYGMLCRVDWWKITDVLKVCCFRRIKAALLYPQIRYHLFFSAEIFVLFISIDCISDLKNIRNNDCDSTFLPSLYLPSNHRRKLGWGWEQGGQISLQYVFYTRIIFFATVLKRVTKEKLWWEWRENGVCILRAGSYQSSTPLSKSTPS